MVRALACAAAAALSAGCIDGDYNRFRQFQPVDDAEVDALGVGTSDVEEALDRLGAPVFVVEVGLGLALAWGWRDTTDWNVDVSTPIGDAQGNFSFTSTNATTRGVVLFFDRDWTLVGVRRGYLGELLPKALPRDVDIALTGGGAGGEEVGE